MRGANGAEGAFGLPAPALLLEGTLIGSEGLMPNLASADPQWAQHMKLFVIHYQLNDKCTSSRHMEPSDPVPLPCVSIKAGVIPYRKAELFEDHRSGGCAGLWLRLLH